MSWPARVLVTGGAGFIGSNMTRRLMAAGIEVVAFDNLSRRHSMSNVQALLAEFGEGARFVHGDVRSEDDVAAAMAGADAVIHLAGQTAVTRSIDDPRSDFLDNCMGTLNVLEAARKQAESPAVLYASTNKVYGNLASHEIVEHGDSYDFASRPNGIDEAEPIDLASPYACSKGAGDQYVRDYARTFGLPTVVFRQSCIYGPHQTGAEEQGWLAWFVRAARSGHRLTIYGDGKQVRDLLYVDDLVDCYIAALSRIEQASGQVYNVGGGAANKVSVWWQLKPMLQSALGQELTEPEFGPWRLGDQRVFYTDNSKAARELAWSPATSPSEGLRRMVSWFDTSRVAT